jgi:hypothetical protein
MRGRGVFMLTLLISGMDNLFFKSVYCLSGLGIVRKNRRISKYFLIEIVFLPEEVINLYIVFCFFFTILYHEFARF